METRIIKRIWKDWDISYVIQRKILWFWYDIWGGDYYWFMESYPTLEEAQKNLCYFDWTKNKDIIDF